MTAPLDLGHGYTFRLNTDRTGAWLHHHRSDGRIERGEILFDSAVAREQHPDEELWTVTAWEPLSLEESVICACGDHGLIREGRWIPA